MPPPRSPALGKTMSPGRLEEAAMGRASECHSLPYIFCGLDDNAKEVIMLVLIFNDRR